MKCPACGHMNLAGHRFCFRCGESLSQEGAAAAHSVDPRLSVPIATGSGYGGLTTEAWRGREGARFDLDNQRVATISNLARDHVVYKVQHSPKLSGPHRAGPWMIGFGGLIFLVGMGVWGFTGFAILGSILDYHPHVPPDPTTGTSFPGVDFHADELAIGLTLAFVGIVVLFIGLFVTIVTRRTRRVRP